MQKLNLEQIKEVNENKDLMINAIDRMCITDSSKEWQKMMGKLYDCVFKIIDITRDRDREVL